MVVQLMASFHWNHVIFNAGEAVDLPEAVALGLLASREARVWKPPLITEALDHPPTDRMMRQQRRKDR